MEFERTFDRAANEYDSVRPSYPNALYSDLFRYKPLDAQSHVLEIGVGTGKATKPVLDTGCRLVGIEPGGSMAAIAEARYADNSRLSLHVQTLQEYICPKESFDLIYAATAFHWIEEAYGYARVYELLKHGGAFARFAYHAGPDQKRTALTEKIQKLYDQYLPHSRPPKPFGAEDVKALASTAMKYGFEHTQYHLYHVEKDFTADEYSMLLRTYPNHMSLEPRSREKLFSGIHNEIVRSGGIITVHYTMDLELATKP